MEGERIATEAPVEPVRAAAAEPSGAPGVALLQRAPAEYVRALSRAYGNRRVALAIQRQPAATAPPSNIVKGYRAVSLKDPRWDKVDSLLTWSRLGWEAREVMRTFSVPLAELDVPAGTADKGAPAWYDAKGNVCYLNLGASPAEISAYFVHEMHHAKQAQTGKSPGAEGFPNTAEHRKKWVEMMVEEEVVGTAHGLRAQAAAREPRAREARRPPGRHGHLPPRVRALARQRPGRGQGRGRGRRLRPFPGPHPGADDDGRPGRAGDARRWARRAASETATRTATGASSTSPSTSPRRSDSDSVRTWQTAVSRSTLSRPRARPRRRRCSTPPPRRRWAR